MKPCNLKCKYSPLMCLLIFVCVTWIIGLLIDSTGLTLPQQEKKSAMFSTVLQNGWVPGAGPVIKALLNVSIGMNSDLELTSLYIKWCQWKWHLSQSLPFYSMPEIISQAEWPSQCSQIRCIWLEDLCFNDLTVGLIGWSLSVKLPTISLSMCPDLHALWLESSQSLDMTSCGPFKVHPNDLMKIMEICLTSSRSPVIIPSWARHYHIYSEPILSFPALTSPTTEQSNYSNDITAGWCGPG